MAKGMTREQIQFLLRMRHGEIMRRPRPKLGQVAGNGVEIIAELSPAPSSVWWECLKEVEEGTVLEGRVGGVNTEIRIQSTEDEFEEDVRRLDAFLTHVNHCYRKRFTDAETRLKEITDEENKSKEAAMRTQRLQERLRKL